MKKLSKYYQRYLLEQIGSSRLYVFQNDKRTTNALESFHANLKRKFCSYKPNYWNFVKKMKKVIKTTEKDMERIDKQIPIRRSPLPIALHRYQLNHELQGKLIRGEINSIDYLESIRYQYKTEFMQLRNLSSMYE